jgi:hypothetical protein
MKRGFFLWACLSLLLVGFQNCSRTNFTSDETSLVSKSSESSETLVPVEDDGGAADPQEEQDEHSCGDKEFVACILEDHGKSLKLGIVSQDADGVHAVAESVCVTRKACLTQVAQAFAVEGAYKRGYCDHNPHVRRLSDQEVKDLLARK